MSLLKRIRVVFGLIWRIDKAYYFLLLLASCSQTGQVLVNVLLPRHLIDSLLGVPGAGEPQGWVVLIALSNLVFAYLRKTVLRLRRVHEGKVQMMVERALSGKLMKVAYPVLEDPHYLDLRERAMFALNNQYSVEDLISSTLDSLSQLTTVIGLVAVMAQLGAGLILSLLACVALMLLIQARFSRYQQQFFEDLMPVNRRYGYYVNLCYDMKQQKDLRLYDMGDILGEKIQQYNQHINRWYGTFFRRMGLYMGLFQVVIVLQTALSYLLVGERVLTGGLGIGSFTMYVTAGISFSTAIIQLGSDLIYALQKLNYLGPLAELMTLPEEARLGGREILDRVRSIRFEDVSFTYPKGEKPVLDHISFSVHQGERISIVGRNGAGKSTIVKLLCRLHEPDAGRILLNELPIDSYDKASLMSVVATVFQDYKLFHFTLAENIACRPADAGDEKLSRVVRKVGLEEAVGRLPLGLQTAIGKSFDTQAAEFSGGEAQKIALARALYKDASLLILDEPTSALDPLAEAEVYAQMDRMAGDRTAIFISHRMSSSVFCDRILVLEDGRVQAFDSHQRLMADKAGLYYRLFQSQAEHFRVKM